ncbi:MAG: PCMD domain-containing protein, partial [Alistipes sp.]|nr:PCMD domain-containing protein [Alistipes sp.]
EVILTLGEAFFSRMPGGENTFTITAFDTDGIEGERESTVRTQGTTAFAETDRWNARGEMTALIFDNAATNVAIRYRKVGATQWSTAAATLSGDACTAVCEGIAAETEYEYQLVIDGRATGAARTAATGSGAQIYNAGFETWTGSSPLLPYTSAADQIWDSGNHGSATLNKNVTTNEPDARPGSAGRTSAKLQSQFVSLFGIGKFAAGNIFVGKYCGTDGTNGIIGFGKPFSFDYRPKALTFWYKGNIGTIDRVGSNAPAGVGSGSSDIAQVYICLCKMDGPHIVATSNASTFLSLPSKTMSYTTADMSDMTDDKAKRLANDRTDGKVIACGVWEPDNSTQYPEWTKITVELEYYDEYEGEVPTYLMLTASASKYGDYFTGSTSSVMYLDDVELVY